MQTITPEQRAIRTRMLLDNMTPEQAETLLTYFERQRVESTSPKSWGEFFGYAIWDGMNDCVMLAYAGMWIGIERDGYGHS